MPRLCDLTAIRAGATPITDLYAGDQHVWPCAPPLNDDDDFVLEVTVPAGAFTLPMNASGRAVVNYTVVWGDGSADTVYVGTPRNETHNYANAGTYEIRVKGRWTFVQFANGPSKLAPTRVLQWGTQYGTDLTNAFQYCTNLTAVVAPQAPNGVRFGTGVTNFSGLFTRCSKLTTVPCDQWNLSAAIDISQMFDHCTVLAALDVANWNVDKVQSFSAVFNACSALTALDVSAWTTPAATSMEYMFANCTNITALDVSQFTTDKVTSMRGMFSALQKATTLGDIDHFNTAACTNFNAFLSGCWALNTPLDFSGWDMRKVTDIRSMFEECRAIPSVDVSGWDLPACSYAAGTFKRCLQLTQVATGTWTNMRPTLLSVFAWASPKLVDADLSTFDMSRLAAGTAVNTSAVQAFTNTPWSTANYDAALLAWAQQTVLTGVTFDAPQTHFSGTSNPAVGAAHAALITAGWTLNDAGPV